MIAAPSKKRPSAVRAEPGLRERKKARLRTTIQTQALRLFAEQGYAETTVDQVAAAADVACSTVFRYFPFKADLVLSYDGRTASVLNAVREMSAISASGLAEAAPGHPLLPGQAPCAVSTPSRWRLILTVPELRTTLLGTFSGDVERLAAHLADRIGRQTSELRLRAEAGALLGALLAVAVDWAESPETGSGPAFDEALLHVAHGIPSAWLDLAELPGVVD